MSVSTIRKLDVNEEVFQDVGTIVEAGDESYVVSTSSSSFRCRRALSCLVEPEQNDEVIFAGKSTSLAGNTQLYILAVLERPGGGPLQVKANGDMRFQLKNGRFVVAAAQGVDLLSTRDISLTSSTLRMHAAEGKVFLEKLSYLGKKVIAEADQAKTFFGVFDSVTERLSQRVKRAYRFVEELDHLRAKQIDHASENTLKLRGRNTLISADLLMKVDADQIHLG